MNRMLCFLIIISFYGFSISVNSQKTDFCHVNKAGMCYKINQNDFFNYNEAKDFCLNNSDSRLLSIHSKVEQDFLVDILNANKINKGVWIEAKLINKSLFWSNSGESIVKYTNWANGYPTDKSGYNCVQMKMNKKRSGKWLNVKCDIKSTAVCEKSQNYFNYLNKSEKTLSRPKDQNEFNSINERIEKIIKHFNSEMENTRKNLDVTIQRLFSESNDCKSKLNITEEFLNKHIENIKSEFNVTNTKVVELETREVLSKQMMNSTLHNFISNFKNNCTQAVDQLNQFANNKVNYFERKMISLEIKLKDETIKLKEDISIHIGNEKQSIKNELYNYKEDINMKYKDLNKKNDAFNKLINNLEISFSYIQSNPIPIDFIYIQFPKQPEPSILWPNVGWKVISNEYSGHFFRVEGGNAKEFGYNQSQSDAFQGHQHKQTEPDVWKNVPSYSDGSHFPWTFKGEATTHILNYDYYGEARVDNETRPIKVYAFGRESVNRF